MAADLKIALVRARYSPYGGAERFAARALGALSRRAEVSVIARSWTAPGADAAPVDLVRCDPFYIGSTWRDWSFARAVQRLVAKGRFDLVQCHERIPGLDIYRAGDGVHASWLERRRAQGRWWDKLAIALNPHHYFLIWIERRMFENPRLGAVICNSRMVIEEISERFAIDSRKLRLIGNGVDLQHFDRQAAREAGEDVRARLGIDAQACVWLFVGSGFARKGLEVALRACADCPPQVHLIVVGSDKHAQRYVRLADRLGLAARCHFVGAQSDPLPYYGAADGFILPSIYDPFPNAVLEALACGLPALTTSACGAKEVIEHGVNGWIVEAGDPVATGTFMQQLYREASDALRTEGRRHAARASVAGHGIERVATELLLLYEELVSERAAGRR